MPDDLTGIDPDLLDVIHDLERGAPSTIFALEPYKLFRAAGRGELPLRSTTTGLTSIDRHVLDVHRHEVAHLLRLRFLEAMEPTAARSGVHYNYPRPPSSAVRDREARVLAETSAAAESAIPGRRLLLPATPQRPRGVSPAELLAASIATDDTPTGRCYLAWLHRTQGERASALRVAGELLGESASPAVRASLCQCLAALASDRRDGAAAYEWYAEAAEIALEAGLPTPVAATAVADELVFALLVGDEEAAVRSGRSLESLLSKGSPFLRTIARRMTAHEVGLDADLRAALDQRLPRTTDRLSDAALELLYALS